MTETDPLARWLNARRREAPSPAFVGRVMAAVGDTPPGARLRPHRRSAGALAWPLALGAAALVLHATLVLVLVLLTPGTAL